MAAPAPSESATVAESAIPSSQLHVAEQRRMLAGSAAPKSTGTKRAGPEPSPQASTARHTGSTITARPQLMNAPQRNHESSSSLSDAAAGRSIKAESLPASSRASPHEHSGQMKRRKVSEKKQLKTKIFFERRAREEAQAAATAAALAARPKVACRFFAVGQCSKGDACTFSHNTDLSSTSVIPAKPAELCKYFMEARCGKGVSRVL